MAGKKEGLTGAVAEAESAVASVKDPELKRAAFEKVLAHLLESQSTPQKKTKSQAAQGKAKGKGKTGPKGHIEELIDENFFKKPRSLAELKAELANRGHHIPLTSLSGPLQTLCKDKRLRRQKGTAGKGRFGYTSW